ncbi:hypothetical protein PQX77_016772 [Marasmius sp. AFHP31]|nr:hypothetical protein PQX77_016772 [Marasmius sp. AFHP31]
MKPDFGGASKLYINKNQPTQLFKMTDSEGKQHFFRMATKEEIQEGHTSMQDDDPNGEKVWDRHENKSEVERQDSASDRSYPPGPGGGSQYIDSPSEYAGFMHDDGSYNGGSKDEDYTHMGESDRVAATWDDDPGYETTYQSCQSDVSSDTEKETHLRLDFNEYFHSITTDENSGAIANVKPVQVCSTDAITCPK